MERKTYQEFHKDGGWKGAVTMPVHLKGDSKIGIIATLGIIAFAVTFSLLNI